MNDTTPSYRPDALPNLELAALGQPLADAVSLHLAGKLSEAENLYHHLVQQQPQNPEVHHFFGILRYDQKKYEDAEHFVTRAIELDSTQAVYYYTLGKINNGMRRYWQAIGLLRKALSMPKCPLDVFNELGSAMRKIGKFDDSEKCYREILAQFPNDAVAYNNLGNTLRDKGALVAAIECFETSLKLQPDYGNAKFNLGFTHLLAGNYQAGWGFYEERLQNSHYTEIINQPDKYWRDQPPPGSTLLVIVEQGLGDTLQFLRFLPLARKHYKHIVLMAQAELVEIINRCKIADHVIPKNRENITTLCFDAYIHLMSLPFVLDSRLDNLPGCENLIAADESLIQKWRQKTADYLDLKVGIAWAGNPAFTNDHNRSCPLDLFTPLLLTQKVFFFSLQKGEAAECALQQLDTTIPLINYMKEVTSFSDTAALISSLDLVITVDTVVAHLAGNLGKPTWILVPYASDWRWLHARSDSPWYPQTRVYRQTEPNNWVELIARVTRDLIQLTKSEKK